ncbi:MAG: c-type cytochrome [Hyphomicrobiaceae bacterium]|nr:c-type cytochrome [Hyphomicrobiaceae bacterium]
MLARQRTFPPLRPGWCSPSTAAACLLGIGLCTTAARADEKAQLRAYGEHLSSECTTCHRIDGGDSGIPSIIGLEERHFVEQLNAFKSGARTNQAMMSVARSLDGEQMAALAAYFSSLKPRK